jgi:hypothetical protein
MMTNATDLPDVSSVNFDIFEIGDHPAYLADVLSSAAGRKQPHQPIFVGRRRLRKARDPWPERKVHRLAANEAEWRRRLLRLRLSRTAEARCWQGGLAREEHLIRWNERR